MKKFWAIFSPSRTITGKFVNPDLFWTEVEKTIFLLQNLQEPHFNWAMTSSYLRSAIRLASGKIEELEVVTDLLSAWLSIAKQIEGFQDHEVNQWWAYRFQAAGDQLYLKVLPFLTFEDIEIFENKLGYIYRSINRNELTISNA